jgi:hypothetical protein
MKKELLHNLGALLYNAVVGVLVALICGFSPLLGVIGITVLMLGLAVFNQFYTGARLFSKKVAFAGLLKEIWIGKLMENFYPDGSWLMESEDMTAFVENNTINLADAGMDPVVLVNNTTYPVPFSERTDVPLALPLDYYDTESTVVRNATAIQLAYDKLGSVVRQHRNALFKKNIQKAAHAYGPSANAAFTPVIEIGASIIDTIIEAEKAFDDLEVPADGRILVLSPLHKAMLKKEDKDLFKDIFGQKGTGELYGFKVYTTSVTPVYDGTTKAKKAFGAAAAGGDLKSSLFYSKYEVMRADGTYDMFSHLKDPDTRGDKIGFQKRFLALPIRNKYIGAIIGNAVTA